MLYWRDFTSLTGFDWNPPPSWNACLKNKSIHKLNFPIPKHKTYHSQPVLVTLTDSFCHCTPTYLLFSSSSFVFINLWHQLPTHLCTLNWLTLVSSHHSATITSVSCRRTSTDADYDILARCKDRLQPGSGLSCCGELPFNPEAATCCKVERRHCVIGKAITNMSHHWCNSLGIWPDKTWQLPWLQPQCIISLLFSIDPGVCPVEYIQRKFSIQFSKESFFVWWMNVNHQLEVSCFHKFNEARICFQIFQPPLSHT